MIKDDPGVFELHCWQSCLALLAKLPCIVGKVALHCWQSCLALVGLIYLSLNNKSESKIQEITLDTGRICRELRSDLCPIED